MKKVYIIKQYLWNGTIVLKVITSAFPTKALAEKCKDAILKDNQYRLETDPEHAIPCTCEIEETAFFESEKEIPILNK